MSIVKISVGICTAYEKMTSVLILGRRFSKVRMRGETANDWLQKATIAIPTAPLEISTLLICLVHRVVTRCTVVRFIQSSQSTLFRPAARPPLSPAPTNLTLNIVHWGSVIRDLRSIPSLKKATARRQCTIHLCTFSWTTIFRAPSLTSICR